jgi:tetratricopeptide (TPR) repeat protein
MTPTAQEVVPATSSSDHDPPLPSCPGPRARRVRTGLLTLGASVAILLSVALLMAQSAPYREWRFSRQPLSTLEREWTRSQTDPVFLYYLGLRLDQQGRYAQADPVLRQAVGFDPESPRLRDEWARALLGSGLATAAFAELRQFVGRHPDSAAGHFALGKYYYTQNSLGYAQQELERSVALDGGQAEVWLFLSEAADGLGDKERAAQAAARAVALDPRGGQYHLLLASLLAQNQSPKAAGNEYRAAVRLMPRNALAHQQYAHFLFDASSDAADHALALDQARRAVALDPTDPLSFLILGRALLANGQAGPAVAPLTQAASLSTDDPTPALELARLEQELGHRDNAEKWQKAYLQRQQYKTHLHNLTEALRVHPESRVLHARIAHLFGIHGNVADSIRYHALDLHLAVDAPPVLSAAAQDLNEGGYAGLALPLVERAVMVSDHSALFHEVLGDALLGTGQFEPAVKEYQKACGWDPAREPALRKRLLAYVHGRDAQAQAAFQQAVRSAKTSIGPRPLTPEILHLVQQAVSIEPKNVMFLRFLMSVQIAQRHFEDAIQTGQKIVAIVPHDPSTNARLGVLVLEDTQAPDLVQVERYFEVSANDLQAAPTRHYGLGLLALRRHQPVLAVRELQQAAALDPSADVTYYNLSEAERMAGSPQEAAKFITIFQKRSQEKRTESELLSNVGQHPNEFPVYLRLAGYLRAHGRQSQAQAVLAEAHRRKLN